MDEGGFRRVKAPEPLVTMPLMVRAVLPLLVIENVLVRVPEPTMISPMSVPSARDVELLCATTAPFVPSKTNCGIR